MELTKEYFEQELGRQFGKFSFNLEKRLEEQTKLLKAYADKQTEKLAIMIEKSIREPHEKRLDLLEKDMQSVKTVLSLS